MVAPRRRLILVSVAFLAAPFAGAATTARVAAPGRIAFESDRAVQGGVPGYHVWVMDSSGKSLTLLRPFPLPTDATKRDSQSFDPAWSPDGAKLVFESGYKSGKYSDLWVMNAASSNQATTQITDLGGPTRNPAWSPSGKSIAFQYSPNVAGPYSLYVIPAVNASPLTLPHLPKPLASNCADPAWSHDGSKIACDGRGDIWTMTADGKGRRPLKNPGLDANPSWSPDGKLIAFGSTRSGSSQIWVMSSKGGAVRELTGRSRSDGQNFDPSWSPDQKTIAFASNRDGNLEIYSMSASGSNQRRLTTDPGVDLVPNFTQR
jgi:TolB protein